MHWYKAFFHTYRQSFTGIYPWMAKGPLALMQRHSYLSRWCRKTWMRLFLALFLLYFFVLFITFTNYSTTHLLIHPVHISSAVCLLGQKSLVLVDCFNSWTLLCLLLIGILKFLGFWVNGIFPVCFKTDFTLLLGDFFFVEASWVSLLFSTWGERRVLRRTGYFELFFGVVGFFSVGASVNHKR